MNKYSLNFKILFLIKLFFLYSIFFIKCYADDLNKTKNLVVLGSDEAKVKIKVFSSLTCPHCANFHVKIVPKIKEQYIDKGKVQIIFIDFPLDQAAFNASKLLHCLEEKKQIKFLDTIYDTQTKWTEGTNLEEINENLKKIVKNLGISSKQFDKCLIDEDISDNILNARIDASRKYSIDSTPTIVINEKKLEGSVSFKNIKKKIEKII